MLKAGLLHLFPCVPAHTAYDPRERLSFAMELPVPAQVGIGEVHRERAAPESAEKQAAAARFAGFL